MNSDQLLSETDPDHDLVYGCIQNRPGAFDQLFNKYWRLVLRLALARLHDLPEAEDAAIEVFTDVWRGLRRFRGQARFSTWLYRIALNRIAKHVRTCQRRPRTVPIQAAADCEDERSDPQARFEEQRRADELLQAIERLHPDQRDALILRHLLELELAEVAQILKLSPAAAGMRVNRALQALREQLKTGKELT
ncbi:MAG: sigma-70 family RNA polymerase sigma factor [candidate division WOR-3 bacterium]